MTIFCPVAHWVIVYATDKKGYLKDLALCPRRPDTLEFYFFRRDIDVVDQSRQFLHTVSEWTYRLADAAVFSSRETAESRVLATHNKRWKEKASVIPVTHFVKPLAFFLNRRSP